MKKIALIIEDDEDLADIFAAAVRGIGFEAENVTDGLRAQERLATGETPFLILLDMHLPRVSGQDLLHTIKNDGRFDGTWTIITTADARLAEQFRDQVDFALIKPILFGQLKDLASRLKPKDEIQG
ncbi:MAG: response regulator [Anaerolineales bacterium]|nr:response regulator [Anaerolineales bacterium]